MNTLLPWVTENVFQFEHRLQELKGSLGSGYSKNAMLFTDYSITRDGQGNFFSLGWAGRGRAWVVFYGVGHPIFLMERGLHL